MTATECNREKAEVVMMSGEESDAWLKYSPTASLNVVSLLPPKQVFERQEIIWKESDTNRTIVNENQVKLADKISNRTSLAILV